MITHESTCQCCKVYRAGGLEPPTCGLRVSRSDAKHLANLAKGFENGFGVLVLAKRLYPEYSIAEFVSAHSPKGHSSTDLRNKQNEGCYILNKCKR